MQIQSKHANKHVPLAKQFIEKRKEYMNDLYCLSSTCMLLKMMEKSRDSVCPPKIRAEGFAEKKILHKQ